MPNSQLAHDERQNLEEVILDLVKTPPRQLPSCSIDCQQSEATGHADDERRRREEEESLELARLLMAEEALASYQHSFNLLRQSADMLPWEDYEALQAALEEEEQEHITGLEDNEGNLSYETMLQLGERIGDVKAERWALQAQKFIEKLPSFYYNSSIVDNVEIDDSECKCLVCQCEYVNGEHLRRLPCGHCFHSDCVEQWLITKDFCPYCRRSIV